MTIVRTYLFVPTLLKHTNQQKYSLLIESFFFLIVDKAYFFQQQLLKLLSAFPLAVINFI